MRRTTRISLICAVLTLLSIININAQDCIITSGTGGGGWCNFGLEDPYGQQFTALECGTLDEIILNVTGNTFPANVEVAIAPFESLSTPDITISLTVNEGGPLTIEVPDNYKLTEGVLYAFLLTPDIDQFCVGSHFADVYDGGAVVRGGAASTFADLDFTVNMSSGGDEVSGDGSLKVTTLDDAGPGSLRQAMLDAAATDGDDIIDVDVSGTIEITTGENTINALPNSSGITLNGNGITIAKSSSLATGRFGQLSNSSVNDVSFDGFVSGGSAGTLFLTGENVLNNCNIKNSSGSSRGSIRIQSGHTTFTNCEFTGNSNGQGGAIYISEGTEATIEGSTFSGNTASPAGNAEASTIAVLGTLNFDSNSSISNTLPAGTPDIYMGDGAVVNGDGDTGVCGGPGCPDDGSGDGEDDCTLAAGTFTSGGEMSVTHCLNDGPTIPVELSGITEGVGFGFFFINEDGTFGGSPGSIISFGEETGNWNIQNLGNSTGRLVVIVGDRTGLRSGGTIDELTGCFDISNELVVMSSNGNMGSCCQAATGDLTISDDGDTKRTITIGDGISDELTVEGSVAAGGTLTYFVTDADGDILVVLENGTIDLEGTEVGECNIYLLAFDGIMNFGPAVGRNISQFVGSCFELSNPVIITREAAVDDGDDDTDDGGTGGGTGDGDGDTTTVEGIPTMGEWFLICLGLIFMILGTVAMRQHVIKTEEAQLNNIF